MKQEIVPDNTDYERQLYQHVKVDEVKQSQAHLKSEAYANKLREFDNMLTTLKSGEAHLSQEASVS